MMEKTCFLNVLFLLFQKLIKIMKAFHHLQHLLSFRYVNMCLLEVASDEKCRSSHFAVGGWPSKFEDWGYGGVKKWALLHFRTPVHHQKILGLGGVEMQNNRTRNLQLDQLGAIDRKRLLCLVDFALPWSPPCTGRESGLSESVKKDVS